ncbi:hypothetical protein FRC12_004778 [Ceratobasidium sp. 428]|nr:hypothetical protein FRC12_004778 [Ceratobasidium sp. 428]
MFEANGAKAARLAPFTGRQIRMRVAVFQSTAWVILSARLHSQQTASPLSSIRSAPPGLSHEQPEHTTVITVPQANCFLHLPPQNQSIPQATSTPTLPALTRPASNHTTGTINNISCGKPLIVCKLNQMPLVHVHTSNVAMSN